MSASSKRPANTLWSRPVPERTQPDRSAGGYYRTAEAPDGRGGLPLSHADDAIVAAVRLAYKVADKQVERSARLARRLQQAGRRAAGPTAERDAVDAMESLVLKSMLSGLSWWEGSVADGRCPVKRLAAAEYRMLGTILGFVTPDSNAGGTSGAASAGTGAGATAAARGDVVDRDARAAGPSTVRAEAHLHVDVVHTGKATKRRFVSVQAFVLTAPSSIDRGCQLYFHHADQKGESLKADLTMPQPAGAPRLSLADTSSALPGLWRAVICDAGDVQRGYIEILL